MRAHAARVGRRMLEQQDVVVARLEERALKVVRLGEGDPTKVAAAQHLPVAFEVQSRKQFTDPLEVRRRRRRLTDAVIEGEPEHDDDARSRSSSRLATPPAPRAPRPSRESPLRAG